MGGKKGKGAGMERGVEKRRERGVEKRRERESRGRWAGKKGTKKKLDKVFAIPNR